MTDRRLNQDPERVRRRRIEAGLNMQEAAARANVAKSHMWGIEHGKANAGPEVLARIADALECEIGDLLPPEEVKAS